MVGIYAIGGMAGIGKTAFAVHAAHQARVALPGRAVFTCRCTGITPVGSGQWTLYRRVWPACCGAAGVATAQIPSELAERTALWRASLEGRRLLLVLDDAASSKQVLPLLPGPGESLVLVTSRRHLSALEDTSDDQPGHPAAR